MKMLRRFAGNAMLTGTRICVLSPIPGTRSSGRTRKQGPESVILGGRHAVPHVPGVAPRSAHMGRRGVRLFAETAPGLADFWRSIILFGRNVASYKFALGKSLLELAGQDGDQVSLEEPAVPFARHLCEHLRLCDKQGTSAQSRFLDACRCL